MIVMTAEEKEILKFQVFVRAIKHNQGIESDSFSNLTFTNINPDKEIEKYLYPIEDITQLTLPSRFGMYKTQIKNIPKRTEFEIEEPVPSENYVKPENHKVRSIFD